MLADDFQHGTNHAYDKQKCRCEVCRSFKREKDKRRRERLRAAVAAGDLSIKHGVATTYSKGNCRCDACVQAYEQSSRTWRAENPRAAREHTNKWKREHPERGREYAQEQAQQVGHPHHYGYQWTGAELEIVTTRTDLTLTQLAKMLGRTRSAVANARHRATHDLKWMRVVGTSESIE